MQIRNRELIGGKSFQRGMSLLELMVVVAIFALVASMATPYVSSAKHQEIDLAATTIAEALRYSRELARIDGQSHGVTIDVDSHQLSVFRLDESLNPALRVYDVYHPITKQLYQLNVNARTSSGVRFSKNNNTGCTEKLSYLFDRDGVVRCVVPRNIRMTSPQILLDGEGIETTVAIDSYTGRVAIL